MLICCGSLTLDNVLTAGREALPQSWGGNVLYSALAARLWHEDVGVVSRAGSDYPSAAAKALEARGIDTGGIAALAEPHGMNVAFCYAADGSRVRAFPQEAIRAIPAADRARFVDYTTHGPDHRYQTWTAFAPDGDDIPAAWMRRATGVHCAAMPVARHVAITARIREACGGDVWVQVDSPWYDERDLSHDHGGALFPLLDALVPSEIDVQLSAPGLSQAAAIDAIMARGMRTIVLKRGAAGATIFTRGSALDVPPYPVDVVDLTGAGDAFCGGFLAGMHLTGDPAAAVHYGTVSASFAIEGAGLSRLLATTADEAGHRLAAFRGRLGPSDPTSAIQGNACNAPDHRRYRQERAT